jgi:uncharacterized membrane protein (Fun14 family)
VAARALRVIVRIAALIMGGFVLGLAFLSYKGWITANWGIIQNQTQSFAYNISAQVLHMVNDTSSKFAAHPSLAHTEATPIAASVGFISGFWIGKTLKILDLGDVENIHPVCCRIT